MPSPAKRIIQLLSLPIILMWFWPNWCDQLLARLYSSCQSLTRHELAIKRACSTGARTGPALRGVPKPLHILFKPECKNNGLSCAGPTWMVGDSFVFFFFLNWHETEVPTYRCVHEQWLPELPVSSLELREWCHSPVPAHAALCMTLLFHWPNLCCLYLELSIRHTCRHLYVDTYRQVPPPSLQSDLDFAASRSTSIF